MRGLLCRGRKKHFGPMSHSGSGRPCVAARGPSPAPPRGTGVLPLRGSTKLGRGTFSGGSWLGQAARGLHCCRAHGAHRGRGLPRIAGGARCAALEPESARCSRCATGAATWCCPLGRGAALLRAPAGLAASQPLVQALPRCTGPSTCASRRWRTGSSWTRGSSLWGRLCTGAAERGRASFCGLHGAPFIQARVRRRGGGGDRGGEERRPRLAAYRCRWRRGGACNRESSRRQFSRRRERRERHRGRCGGRAMAWPATHRGTAQGPPGQGQPSTRAVQTAPRQVVALQPATVESMAA